MGAKPERVFSYKPTAILVDGGFFHQRYKRCYPGARTHSAKQVAKNMYTMVMGHVEHEQLYRILYYDCPPLSKKVHNPITKSFIEFGSTEVARFRYEFYEELKRYRKVALRFGELKDRGGWIIRPKVTKSLLNEKIKVNDLTEEDITYDVTQKGVDIRIGLDIASLAYKNLVGRIVLVSGDSDFVPAAKLARREGIDFILDAMWSNVEPKLFEHIDGLKSTCEKPKRSK